MKKFFARVLGGIYNEARESKLHEAWFWRSGVLALLAGIGTARGTVLTGSTCSNNALTPWIFGAIGLLLLLFAAALRIGALRAPRL